MAHRLTHDVSPWRSASLVEAETLLAERWGHARFRYHQRRAVLAALRGRDCFALLPTGGGKSICFQVPALLLPGVTVVVSPLISLMQDRRSRAPLPASCRQIMQLRDILQSLNLPQRRHPQNSPLAPQDPVADLLPPPRQHERVGASPLRYDGSDRGCGRSPGAPR